MTHSETTGKIALALAKAQGAIEGAPKDSSNPHFNSRYADLASIVDACRPALAANEIAVLQSPSADANLVRMTTLLLHSSGEWIQSDELQVQARDANPQAVGSCLTYLRRYQLAAMVGVAPDDDDAEAAEGRTARPVAVMAPKPKPVELAPDASVPAGFALIDEYRQDGDWHQVTWGRDAQGGSMVYKTKIPKVGLEAAHAYREKIPVRLKSKKVPYLDEVEVRDGERAWVAEEAF